MAELSDRGFRRPPLWILGTCLVGVTLSFAFFKLVRTWEQQERRSHAWDLVEQQDERLRTSMLCSIEVLYSIRSLWDARGGIEREEFRRFVRQALERQPELQALSWNPIVPGENREEFELRTGHPIQEKEIAGLVAAATRDYYVPVSYIEPAAGNIEALGYDLRSDPVRRECLQRAEQSGKPIGTAALRLTQGPKDSIGFLVVLPVYKQASRNVAGYAVAVFRVPALVSGAFEELRQNGIEAELRDASQENSIIFSTVSGRTARIGAKDLVFADHRWSAVYYFTPLAFGEMGQAWLVLFSGLAFTGIASAYLWTACRRAGEAAYAADTLKLEVAERKSAEKKAALANQAKSDFLASMSHEMRTPLNAILGYTQLMQREVDLSPEERDSVAGIHGNGLHLLGLINEVLDLSKIEAGRMELHASTFDLNSLAKSIRSTFRPLCAQKRIGLQVIVLDQGYSRVVRGDEGKLRQVLINLLGNAEKFTTVGEVSLRITALEQEHWLFEIIDSGMGIPEDEQACIFEPFHQGRGAQHFGGTGLGLAIAHRQVELMGGELEFQSERGEGTRFFFSLRLAITPCEDIGTITEGDSDLNAAPLELEHVALPNELRERLSLATELHSATALKNCLREVRELGAAGEALAGQIRVLLRSYDMNGIARLLEHVATPTEGGLEIHDGIGKP